MTKEQFFKKYEDAIFKIAQKGSKVLLPKLIQIIKRMKSEGGTLTSSSKNNAVIKELFKAIKQYMKSQSKEILKFSIKAFDELLKMNSDYFGVSIESFKAELFDNLGIKNDKTIIKNSIFDKLIQDTGVSKSVAAIVQKAIRAKETIQGLIGKITELFTPTVLKNPSVLVTQLVKNGGFNYLQIQDRMIARAMADEVGFSYGIYGGTLKNNTREFCRARVNRVYSLSEIKSWDNLTFNGKYPNHNSMNDCGGWNCRHVLNWVSKETAERIAKERRKPINSYN